MCFPAKVNTSPSSLHTRFRSRPFPPPRVATFVRCGSWTEPDSRYPPLSSSFLRNPNSSEHKLHHASIMAAKARPYKNYLSPFLHRQFGYVMGLTLVLCYVESLWIGQWDSCTSHAHQPPQSQATNALAVFWVWFSAGVRALLLFISFLFVLCLCMAHSHSKLPRQFSGQC